MVIGGYFGRGWRAALRGGPVDSFARTHDECSRFSFELADFHISWVRCLVSSLHLFARASESKGLRVSKQYVCTFVYQGLKFRRRLVLHRVPLTSG